MKRRHFLGSAAALSAATLGGWRRTTAAAARPATIKPKRLAAGDTVALVAPASATFNTIELQIARESLRGARAEGARRRPPARPPRLSRRQDKDRPATSTASSPTTPSARSCRSGAGGAAAGCCPTWISRPSAVTRRSCSATATSPRSTWPSRPRPVWSRFTAQRHRPLGRRSRSAGCGACSSTREAVTLDNLHDKGEFLVQTEHRVQTITPARRAAASSAAT